VNDNQPTPRESSNLRVPRFMLSARMIAAMLGEEAPAPTLIALTNTRLKPPVLVSQMALVASAKSIVNSALVIHQFAACEWDELSEDAQVWITAIVEETLRRASLLAHAGGDHG